MALMSMVRDIILSQVVDAVQPDSGWKVMVVDSAALHVISSCCRSFDISDRGVSLVENLAISRQPMPNTEAIYFVAPTLTNVELIKKDFARRGRPKYAAAHVFFIDVCPDSVLSVLGSGHMVSGDNPVLKTCTELYLSYIPVESRVFTLGDENEFYRQYSEHSQGVDVEDISAKIATVCASMGEKPVVRFQESSDTMRRIATSLQTRLDVLAGGNDDMKANAKNQSQVILLDRNFDLYSPLVHELTYQAAAYDLLPVEKDVFSYQYDDAAGRRQTKPLMLDEKDDLWVKFRHDHISSVFTDVSDDFQKFSADAQSKQGDASGDKTKQLKDMIKQLPQHQEKMQKFGMHLDMSSKINTAFSRKVESCTRAEQNIVCGEEPDGSKVRDVIGEIATLLSDKKVTESDKLRVLMVCMIAKNGISKRELENLLDSSGLSAASRECVYNLARLGVKLIADKGKKLKLKRKAREPDFDLSRWTPIIKDVMEDAASLSLSTDDYPAVRDDGRLGKGKKGRAEEATGEVQSARKQRGGWAKNKGKAKSSSAAKETSVASAGSSSKKLFMFVAGAVSYNEMRAAYEVSEAMDCDVFIGSTCLATPKQFMAKVGELSKRKQTAAVVQRAAEEVGGLTITTGKTPTFTDVEMV